MNLRGLRPAVALAVALLVVSGCASPSPSGSAPSSSPTPSQAGTSARSALAGTGLQACPSPDGLEAINAGSARALRQAILAGNVQVQPGETGLTGAIPTPQDMASAQVTPGPSHDHASILVRACGASVVDHSLVVTVCGPECRSASAEAAKVSSWWFNRHGQWVLWTTT